MQNYDQQLISFQNQKNIFQSQFNQSNHPKQMKKPYPSTQQKSRSSHSPRLNKTARQTQFKSNLQKQNKLFQECIIILKHQTIEQNNKWLQQNKINSYSLRNDKAGDIVNTMNYIFQKVLISGDVSGFNHHRNQYEQKQPIQQYTILNYLFKHYKSASKKIVEFCHLIKHFSLWDYQFQYFFQVFLGYGLNNINLYLTCRNLIIQSSVNKYKKAILSGVLAEIQQWSKLAQNIFKTYDQRTVIQQFVEVVKSHYIEVKKNENQRINGAQFFKICQIIHSRLYAPNQQQGQFEQNNKRTPNKGSKQHNQPTIGQVFKQTLLKGLTMQDRQLIRILSFKDKNIARLLEQKHNKMVNMIGQQVDSLRKDIEIQKRKYLQVIDQKKYLVHLIQKIKRKTLEYVVNPNVKNQDDLFEIFEQFNKKYNPHTMDIQKCKKEIEYKRLLQIITEQQKMP